MGFFAKAHEIFGLAAGMSSRAKPTTAGYSR
jgi:hypothetical protein